MNNRNATASWSGFSFQGQVGLLVTLIEMQKVDITQFDKYFLEYENREDVAIYKLKDNQTQEYLSVHQVKAYYSDGHLINTYKDVFRGKEIFKTDENGKFILDSEENKISLGFKDTGWCEKDNYLHTAVEITNWTQEKVDTIGNPFNVKRFEYTADQNFCDINLIKEYTLEEIRKITGERINDKSELILANLTMQLDEKIRHEHSTKPSKNEYDLKFSFTELLECIETRNSIIVKENIYISRKLFYDRYIENLRRFGNELDPLALLEIMNIVENIYKLDNSDFTAFLIKLNLNEKAKDLNYSQFHFNAPGLKQVFFPILFSIKNYRPFIEDNFIKYKQELHESSPYVLTTIIEEKAQSSDALQNIIENIQIQRILWESHALINKDISARFIDIDPNIMNIKSEDNKDEDRFMGYNKRTRFINREDTKKELNND